MSEEQPKILIIDDERLLRKSLQRILEKADFYVETALDYQSAKKALKLTDFDILIVDIILPQVNGIELVKKIQGEIEGFNSAVIFITGEPNLETCLNALRLGAYDYLEKPVSRQMLMQAIKRVLMKRKINIRLISESKKKSFVIDDSFLVSDSTAEIEDFKEQTTQQLEEIFEALMELKKKYGETFDNDQKELLNIVAKNNNEMRKIWNR